MSQIRILPEILANKIAAGEVVERPASVVKELVENSLDAGSTRILIEIEKGGRSLIRVSDNGSGMSYDDALLALERYATSKIYNDRDLFSINTLGFRGEALPSIASVSKFIMETRKQGSQAGVRIEIEGGKLKKVSEKGIPVGTMIAVSRLFYNTPARRKFLKTINTEMAHIGDIVSSIAMGWPGVTFRLNHNGKLIKSWTKVKEPFDRAVNILGREIRDEFYRLNFKDEGFSLSGWIASSKHTKATSRGIYIYVNGRYVRDRIIQHALFKGYEGRVMKGRFPIGAIFIKVPPDQVDVNVHPAKSEVRFINQRYIHDKISSIIGSVLSKQDSHLRPKGAYVNKAPEDMPTGLPIKREKRKKPENSFFEKNMQIAEFEKEEYISHKKNQDPQIAETKSFEPAMEQESLWEKKQFGDLKIIGQVFGTYIVCESGDGMILIDQHAAHERILFEKLKKGYAKADKRAQKLLVPETIELGFHETSILEKMIPLFKNTGLDIEPFGGNTFIITSVPSILGQKSFAPLISEIIEKAAETGVWNNPEKAAEEALILMACHGALRAHHRLSEKQMRALIDQLDRCETPSNCPHGRPTWIKWTQKSLEKSFGRIV